jgi:DNA-cytosine methyltransferase
MNVLSLFNGMSTGHTALDNVGIKVDKYYSSEIKPAAIKLTQHHYPDTIQLGDVTKWKEWDIEWSEIDMVLSGSPCQDLSIAGKRKGLKGERSGLFFTFVDILNHVKKYNPNVLFLQENVGSAPREDVGIMSRELGVYPVRINSSLVTAQLRDRYYWSNIRTRKDGLFGDLVTDIPQPKDRKIMFKDIVTGGAVKVGKCRALLERNYKSFGHKDKNSEKAQKYLKGREKFGSLSLVYVDKSTCLAERTIASASYKDMNSDKAQKFLKERESRSMMSLIYVDKDKHSCLTEHYKKAFDFGNEDSEKWQKYARKRNENTGMVTLIEQKSKVRIVNKIEMCRLQGFPDDWCDILTDVEVGSLLGDGWTLPVIEHIFSFIKDNK